MTVIATALLLPTSLPRCLLAWAICAGVAWTAGLLLALVDLVGRQWRG